MPKKIYIDMDGTLCRFHDTKHQYIEAMWTQGFYNNLQPFENFLNGLSLCIDRNPDTEFYVLSAVLDTEPPFAESEKREWLHRYLPQLTDEHMIFTPAGTDKSEFIGEINSDCCLIDDYNKNLNEWQRAGGTAIKFINDINNRGLGAYGGEKGNLWSGLSIEHNQSSMDICLQIEKYSQIARYGEKASARYGFEGDVLPWDFSDNILPYFKLRFDMDYNEIRQLSKDGETFEKYLTGKSHSSDLFNQIKIKEYMNVHQADKALISCLEKCYSACRINEISAEKINAWIVASIKSDNMWRTYPVTPANVQMYITLMIDRDKQLEQLAKAIDNCSIKLKKYERALFLPSSKDAIDDFLFNGEKKRHIKSECDVLNNKLENLKSEWLNIAKYDYPNLAYGNKYCRYSSYSKCNKFSIQPK